MNTNNQEIKLTIHLYLDHRSGCCRRVMAAINHLSIDLGEVFIPDGNNTLMLYDILGHTLHAPIALAIIIVRIMGTLMVMRIIKQK